MELKIDAPLHKKSIAALRCFSRAVELCEGIRKLWIEYGSLAYQLHSHASRQLHMVCVMLTFLNARACMFTHMFTPKRDILISFKQQ